jgi:ankyrin repeat protein
LACVKGHEAVVSLLLERGAIIDAQDKVSMSPLHCACLGGHGAVVSLLLDKGAAINAQEKVCVSSSLLSPFARRTMVALPSTWPVSMVLRK